jgi:hypothetical protein
MQLTKLRAAPVRQAEVPPCAPAGGTDGGTASQLIRGVGRTKLAGGRNGRVSLALLRTNSRCLSRAAFVGLARRSRSSFRPNSWRCVARA